MKTVPLEERRAPVFQLGALGLNSDWGWASGLPVAWASSKGISCPWERIAHVPFGEVISSLVFLSWRIGQLEALFPSMKKNNLSFLWLMYDKTTEKPQKCKPSQCRKTLLQDSWALFAHRSVFPKLNLPTCHIFLQWYLPWATRTCASFCRSQFCSVFPGKLLSIYTIFKTEHITD